ncbi:hypothetical protein A2U01_0088970 [Trifolium medium]|uniref:Uncharacterized protein n=1 Tax=Trifolium medium TaxID=97028 RepID=A0A392U2P5_9FABA|nr:hypothetical protein [Trifolium medium]
MAPGAVLEVARGHRARWWRGSRQPSPVVVFLPDLSSLPAARRDSATGAMF